MMMNLIAELSTGGKTPDGAVRSAIKEVIYQCSEDENRCDKAPVERCRAD